MLPFVAGTTQAREAVLDASIPQTASISRDAGGDLSVAYDGDARFQDVPESPGVAYATNSPEDVLRGNDGYYYLSRLVWLGLFPASLHLGLCCFVRSVRMHMGF